MKLFVSDLHLDPQRPQTLRQFERCLSYYDADVRELFILGDLFEYWIGDDYLTESATQTANLLRALSDRGVPVYFIPGNRDFLIGEAFAALCGMQFLEDGAIIDIHGTATLLCHGDHLCTDDPVYQSIRGEVRDSRWQQAVLAKPVEERLAMATQARDESKSHTSQADEAIMDVNAQAVMDQMASAGVQQMIHGHTHRPAIHKLTVNGQPAKRLVLGDWYSESNIRVIVDDQLVKPFS
ncbi:MAG: UDP-2,3-diacylglucosamine diphosphatase [Lysobacterales bacterium]